MRALNIYPQEGPVRIWLRVAYELDGDSRLALECSPVAGAAGRQPEWFREELQNDGLSSACDFPIGQKEIISWMMHYGLAPFQAFQMEIHEPRWYKCSYEYDEWDAEYESGMVDAEDLPPLEAASRWERHQRIDKICQLAQANARRRQWETVAADVGAMYLKRQEYHDRYWDGWPGEVKGVYIRLYSPHERYNYIAEGRSDRNEGIYQKPMSLAKVTPSWDTAMERLVENARKRIPSLTEEQIRALPVKPF